MQVFISHQSALQFWRNPGSACKEEHVLIAKDHVPSLTLEEAGWLCESWGLDLPVHASVSERANKRRPKTLCCHFQRRAPLNTGFCHVGKSTYVASPELMVLQLAELLSRVPLLEPGLLKTTAIKKRAGALALAVVCCELMGSYRLSAQADGFVTARPLLQKGDLARLLEQNTAFSGRRLLEFASEHSVEGSASPAETALALFETLPLRCGGMGLAEMPILNAPVHTRYCQHETTRYPDQLFAGASMVVEYNGSYHAGERANSDDRRRLELENEGYAVKSINKEQLLNPTALEQMLAPLRTAVGTCGRKPSDYASRRADMRLVVLEMNMTGVTESGSLITVPQLLPVR